MQRVTISMDEQLASVFDQLLAERGYASRSEGMRDIVRDAVREWQDRADLHALCVANLSYVYDRDTRALAERLSDMQHANHDLVITTQSVRLDHRYSFESMLLRGTGEALREFASRLLAERGVTFGALNAVNVERGDQHVHADDRSHDRHSHLHPVRS